MHLLSISIAASTTAAPGKTKDIFYVFIQVLRSKAGFSDGCYYQWTWFRQKSAFMEK